MANYIQDEKYNRCPAKGRIRLLFPMYRTPLSGLLLILLTLSGCEINSGVFSRRINVMDYLQTKYDIYYDLENLNDEAGNCGIEINTPNDDVTVNYQPNDRASDAAAFQNEIQVQSQSSDQDDPVEQEAVSSNTSYSSGLGLDDFGEAPVIESTTSSSTAEAFNSGADNVETFGSEENPLYRLTVTSIRPSEFTDIRISHPTTRAATLETQGWARVVMKQTSRSNFTTRYDSVEVSVKYFINQTPQGRWTCTERVVTLLDALRLPEDEDPEESFSIRPEVGW